MNQDEKRLIELAKEMDAITQKLKKSYKKEQSKEVATYLNGLYRKSEIKPKGKLPEIYILTESCQFIKGWYMEDKDLFIPYGGKTEDNLIFDENNVWGWCYVDELFPDTSKLNP